MFLMSAITLIFSSISASLWTQKKIFIGTFYLLGEISVQNVKTCLRTVSKIGKYWKWAGQPTSLHGDLYSKFRSNRWPKIIGIRKVARLLSSGGGQVVSTLAFYSNDKSFNPAEVYNFSAKIVFEKNENKQKESSVGPSSNKVARGVFYKCHWIYLFGTQLLVTIKN